jgi:hypothetical protein
MIRRLVLSTLILSAFFSGLLMCALREPLGLPVVLLAGAAIVRGEVVR